MRDFMTICVYLNLPFPIMISDCLASPLGASTNIYSPSNIELRDGEEGHIANLTSKFIEVDKDTLISFAGRSDHIAEFIDHFPRLWAEKNPAIRPMEFLADLDYKIRRARGRQWKCSVLGASIIKPEGSDNILVNNYSSPSNNFRFETRNFGTCFSIGSGAKDFREFFERADRRMCSTLYRSSTSFQDRTEILWKLIGALCGETIYCQSLFGSTHHHYGGMLQIQTYLEYEARWLRTPAWMHFALIYRGKELAPIGIHTKTVIHTSKINRTNTSGVVTLIDNKGDRSARLWPIYSPFLKYPSADMLTKSDLLEPPRLCTITQFFEIGNNIRYNHSTYPTSFIPTLSFASDHNGINFNIDYAAVAEWLRNELLFDPSIADLIN